MATKNISEHQFLWQIENFSACTEDTSYYLRSPVLRAVDLDDSYWNIVLAPRGDMDDRFVSVRLIRSSGDLGPAVLHLDLELCLIDVNGEERFKRRDSCFCREHAGSTFRDFVRRSDIFEDGDTLLPNDVLTLLIRTRKSDCSQLSATRSVVRTKVHVERSSFLWTIRGLTRGASANRRAFHIDSRSMRKRMELTYVCGNTVDRPGSAGNGHLLRLAIRLKGVYAVQISVSAKVQVLDGHLKPRSKVEAKHTFHAGCTKAWHLPSVDISDWMESLSEGNRLDLALDFCFSEVSHCKQRDGAQIPLADKSYPEENTLHQDMRSVYESTVNVEPDIQLIVCDDMRSVSAHKCILGARSLVFREVLTSFAYEKKERLSRVAADATSPETQDQVCVRHEIITAYVENGEDYAEISHISTSTLEQMLRCMYTDTLNPDDEKDAFDLYLAGVVFDFRRLREMSEDYLKSSISFKSFYTILEFARLNGIAELKNQCVNFIVNNWEYILTSDEWVLLRKLQEDLAQEILDRLNSLRQ